MKVTTNDKGLYCIDDIDTNTFNLIAKAIIEVKNKKNNVFADIVNFSSRYSDKDNFQKLKNLTDKYQAECAIKKVVSLLSIWLQVKFSIIGYKSIN